MTCYDHANLASLKSSEMRVAVSYRMLALYLKYILVHVPNRSKSLDFFCKMKCHVKQSLGRKVINNVFSRTDDSTSQMFRSLLTAETSENNALISKQGSRYLEKSFSVINAALGLHMHLTLFVKRFHSLSPFVLESSVLRVLWRAEICGPWTWKSPRQVSC